MTWELSPGLSLTVDESGCVVLESILPVNTVTNVSAFKTALDEAAVAAAVHSNAADIQDPDAPPLDTVHVDPVNGHIVVFTGETRHDIDRRWLTFADLGSVLNVWTGHGGDLTPKTAAELGAALTAWAARHTTTGDD